MWEQREYPFGVISIPAIWCGVSHFCRLPALNRIAPFRDFDLLYLHNFLDTVDSYSKGNQDWVTMSTSMAELLDLPGEILSLIASYAHPICDLPSSDDDLAICRRISSYLTYHFIPSSSRSPNRTSRHFLVLSMSTWLPVHLIRNY
jgi:hypothetical protein